MNRQTPLFLAGAVAVVSVVAMVGNHLSTNVETVLETDPGNASQVALGKVAYEENCASCHGVGLEGERNWRQPKPGGGLRAPPHDETGHTWHHPDDLLFKLTKEGGKANNPRSGMPGFGSTLTDEEIWAVLAYIKSRWPGPIRERQRELSLANRGQ